MKKLSVFLVVALAAVMCSGIFYACKKDPADLSSTTLIKERKSLEGSVFGVYEIYTPENENVFFDKLMEITECINHPNHVMPNMELKEAIFHLEAVFNIGVCAKQQYAPVSVTKEKTYLMQAVPFEGSPDEIILNGNNLLTKYTTILRRITSELCGNYAITFGDLYVYDINFSRKTIDFGLTVLYGHKGFDRWHSKKIIENFYDTRYAPVSEAEDFPYIVANLSGDGGFVKDTGMSMILNCRQTYEIPLGLKYIDSKTSLDPNYPNYSPLTPSQGLYYEIVSNTAVLKLANSAGYPDINVYGNDIYGHLDNIDNEVLPQLSLSACQKPWWGIAVLQSRYKDGNLKKEVWHAGIEYIYQNGFIINVENPSRYDQITPRVSPQVY